MSKVVWSPFSGGFDLVGWKWMVDLAGDPQAMHEYSELAGQSDDRLTFSDAGHKALGPALEGGGMLTRFG
jgi:hypothetical protein